MPSARPPTFAAARSHASPPSARIPPHTHLGTCARHPPRHISRARACAAQPARFHRDNAADAVWVKDRTHESYAKTYAIVFPSDESLAGRAECKRARSRSIQLGSRGLSLSSLPSSRGLSLSSLPCRCPSRACSLLCSVSPRPPLTQRSHDCAATPHNPTGGARCSALYEPLARRGCVYQARHGFERPGWFLGDGVGPAALPKPYDYYGAYSAEDSGWRLGAGAADVPSHSEHLYHRTVDGELTFDWPSSFDAVASECAAAREGVALFDTSYFGKLRLDGSRADAAMQWLCAADLEGRPTGSVTYTPLCNANGGVEADLTVTKLDDNAWYIVTGGATGAISQLGARVRGRGWGGGKSGRAGQAGRGGREKARREEEGVAGRGGVAAEGSGMGNHNHTGLATTPPSPVSAASLAPRRSPPSPGVTLFCLWVRTCDWPSAGLYSLYKTSVARSSLDPRRT